MDLAPAMFLSGSMAISEVAAKSMFYEKNSSKHEDRAG
jgi:hypothetical protein